jgi:hypothetical protein
MKVSVGDMIWVKLKGSHNDYGFGEVIEVFKSKEGKVSFDFYCLINGGQRFGYTENIIEKPTGRMVAKLSQSQIELKEVLKVKR